MKVQIVVRVTDDAVTSILSEHTAIFGLSAAGFDYAGAFDVLADIVDEQLDEALRALPPQQDLFSAN